MRSTSILGLIVLYHPGAGVEGSITTLAPQVERLVVFDNTPGKSSLFGSPRLASIPNLSWVSDGRNLGIGVALNRALQMAQELGIRWVLSFDQDSEVQGDYVARMLPGDAGSDTTGAVAMHVPALPGDGLGPGTMDVARAITSGSIAHVNALLDAGGYREDFFIDYVDFEMCIRLRRRGNRIVRHGDLVLGHRIGSPSTAAFAGMAVTTTNHAPVRRYYKLRNRVEMVRRHFTAAPLWLTREVLSSFWEAGKILALEDDKAMKLRAMVRGVRDGLSGRLGPLSPGSGADGAA